MGEGDKNYEYCVLIFLLMTISSNQYEYSDYSSTPSTQVYDGNDEPL
jgi:hypothetical protein